MGRLRAVILDMDGTMVDTEPLSQRAWTAAIRPFGYEIDDALQARLIGWRADATAQMVLEAFPLPLSPDELIRRAHAAMADLLADGPPVRPGLYELHDAITRRDLPWGVATSSSRAYAQRMLDQLGLADDCRAIVGGDEVVRGKPEPDIYRLAAERLGVPAPTCLAVEDSAPGCRAAVAAGMTAVAVPGGHATAADFPFAHHVFESLGQVATALDALVGKEA